MAIRSAAAFEGAVTRILRRNDYKKSTPIEKDIGLGLNVQEISFRWITLKICILMYFEVLNSV